MTQSNSRYLVALLGAALLLMSCAPQPAPRDAANGSPASAGAPKTLHVGTSSAREPALKC